MKNPAPPPPGPPQAAPRRLPRNIVPDGGVAVSAEIKENVLRPRVELQLNLPNGAHTTSTFDGRKALMDLLVEVCGQYHLNPAYHTLELLSSEGQPVAFKPNAFLGSLDVACALIKERVVDEKLVRKPAPRVPEKTVRLVVNYHRSQKTVVRVSPLVPLHALVPAICQKCEFDPVHVLLLRDSVSRHELDLNKSLSDLEIRELYALDQSLVLQPKMASAPALNYAESTCSTQSVGTAEKKGLLGFFKFNRRKSKTDSLSSSDLEEVDGGAHVVESAGNDQYTLSGVSTSLEARPSTLGQSQSVMNISKMSPKAELKKRRAPAPPPHTSQSYGSLEMQTGSASTSSLLKKRKAPAPPPTPASRTPTPTATHPTRDPDDDAHQAAPQTSSSSLTTATIASATAAAIAVTTATVVLPPVEAARRVAALQDDSASEVSGSSEESERAAALCSSSSSQADSVPSSHLDEVAISSQDEEEEYEDVEEEEEEEEEDVDGMEMELQLQVLQQLQQKSRQQFSQTKPVEVERLQQQQPPSAQTLTTQGLQEYQVLEPKPQQQQPQPAQQQLPQQPQVHNKQEQSEEQLQDSDRSTTSADSSSTVSLRIDESENNRHSAIDAGRQAPVKPRRTPIGDLTFRAASASPALVERNSHNSSPDSFTDMQQHSWLHSARPAGGAEVQVDSVETGSVSSSSGSFADQGYAASEGTAEDPCPLGSPSDLSPPHVPREASSDSDEGCATWNSRTSQKGQAGKIKNSFEEDPKLMAQLQLTLADLDAELAVMNNSIESPSEADDVIPVSVVDLVPVTTIDEVPDMQLSNSQNKNNNATLCPEPVVQRHVSAEVRGSKTKQEVKQEVRQEVKQVIPASKDKTHKSEPPVREKKAGSSATGTKPAPTQSSSVLAPPKAQPVSGSQSSRAPPRAEGVSQDRIKITQMPASRFGTKTFTIVPNKVTVPSTEQAQGSLSLGAIKIDEQGNMVMRGGVQQRVRTLAEQGEKKEEVEKAASAAMPLGGKAKAFWTSADKQEAPTATKTTMTTTAASAVFRKLDVSSKPAQGEVIIKPSDKPQPQPTASSSVSLKNTSSTAKDGSQAPWAIESRPASTEPTGPTQRATSSVQDVRDLSFLKPQKRTSSQYMATALSSKFTVRSAARADGIKEKPEPEPSTPVPSQKRSVEVRTTTTTSINSSVSKHSNGSTEVGVPKENGSVSSLSITRSPPAYRSHTFHKQTTVERSRPLQGGAGTASEVDSVVVNNKTKLTTHVPANKTETTHKPSSVQLDQNPEPWATSGVLADSNQVSLFGPVKKFRPVIQKSIEKDTSLHSSLMEAIQSGDNKDRLRKVSAGSGLQKPAPVEEENSHSALLSAIRANNSSRLKKTRSEAARELDHLRASESELSVSQIHTSPPPAPAPPVSAEPPPPPPPAAAPPLVALVSAGNPEQTREAMLEAIRSGAGAKALKRVPVATKTVQVNGRLGTMKASCSLSQS